MRILHVSPMRKLEHGSDTEDLGLAHSFLASYVYRNLGSTVEIQVVYEDVIDKINDFKPDIVAISAMTYNFRDAAFIASKAKEIGASVIIGGHHISILPNQLTEDMDVGVISEGEEIYLELLTLYKNRKWGVEYWKDVQGIVFRTPKNELFITSRRPLIKNLDTVGHPMRELSPRTKYLETSIVTSRGCPYSCTFCSQTRFWQLKIRFHSPEYVIKEIENVYTFSKTDHINIDDAIFLINKNRLKKIVELWENHPLYGKISFGCAARANLIDDEMAILAKRMGITGVFFGFESNNPESLAYLKGHTINIEDNQRAYDIMTKNKIRVHGDFIIGTPNETKSQIMDTYNFIKKNRNMTADISHLVPIPGTPIWDYAREKKLVSEDMDFSILGGQETGDKSFFLSETLSKAEMVKLFSLFSNLSKKRRCYFTFKKRLSYLHRDPLTIPGKIINKIKGILG